jgi:stage V sporulation protein SpoVS
MSSSRTETESASAVKMHSSARSSYVTVGADSWLWPVAAMITSTIRGGKSVVVCASGTEAGERAMEAAALAYHRLMGEGIDVVCSPSFGLESSGGQHRTALRLEMLTA